MRYYYDESRSEAVKRTVDTYRHAATFLKPLRDTINKYSGKVYNKRFVDALREAASYERIYAERRTEMVFIYYYEPQRYEPLTLCRIALKDKRIDAAESAASAVEYYTKRLKDAAEIEEYAPQVDTIQQQLDDLDRLKAKIIKSLPYEICDIYGIR